MRLQSISSLWAAIVALNRRRWAWGGWWRRSHSVGSPNFERKQRFEKQNCRVIERYRVDVRRKSETRNEGQKFEASVNRHAEKKKWKIQINVRLEGRKNILQFKFVNQETRFAPPRTSLRWTNLKTSGRFRTFKFGYLAVEKLPLIWISPQIRRDIQCLA